jgi:hypothetical protein
MPSALPNLRVLVVQNLCEPTAMEPSRGAGLMRVGSASQYDGKGRRYHERMNLPSISEFQSSNTSRIESIVLMLLKSSDVILVRIWGDTASYFSVSCILLSLVHSFIQCICRSNIEKFNNEFGESCLSSHMTPHVPFMSKGRSANCHFWMSAALLH